MKEKYKRRIREFASLALEAKLENKTKDHLGYIPSEIKGIIKEHVAVFPLPPEDALGPKDAMGSKLQQIGREIADQLLEDTIELIIPFVNEEVGKRKIDLAKMHLLADKSEDAMNILKKRINRGRIGKSSYWRGADVIISPIRVENTSKTQVVTGTEDLAGYLSWLFTQLRDDLSPFITYLSKFRFYGELADAANNTLLINNQEDINKDVLLSVLLQADTFREEGVPSLKEFFNKEKNSLEKTEIWLSTIVKKRVERLND